MNLLFCLYFDVIIKMSHLKIQRKQTHTLRSKMHSEESMSMQPRHSVGKILHDNINRRRNTANYSFDKSQDLQLETELEEVIGYR